MKAFNKTVAAGVMACFLLFSCKKEFQEPIINENTSQALAISASSCKPTTFATYETPSGAWTTIMQKWYSNNRVQYLKAHFSGRPENIGLTYGEPILNVDWGEVIYEGDQVKVRDVSKDLLVFRATLDASGKPVASYLYNYMGNANEWVFIDTSYYYYYGDRLNYIIQLFEKRFNNTSIFNAWEQYTFTYNTSGDLANHLARNEQVTTEFVYGSTPVSGNVGDYVLTTSYKMLELLELIKVPMNHPLIEIDLWKFNPRSGPFKFYSKSFYNFSITDGLVQYYLNPYSSGGYLGYYIGWNCEEASSANDVQRQNKIVTSLSQFTQLYPKR